MDFSSLEEPLSVGVGVMELLVLNLWVAAAYNNDYICFFLLCGCHLAEKEQLTETNLLLSYLYFISQ